jgi:hypothetical protein
MACVHFQRVAKKWTMNRKRIAVSWFKAHAILSRMRIHAGMDDGESTTGNAGSGKSRHGRESGNDGFLEEPA